MKKSFILHIDSLDILDDLTIEQSGKLFKAIRDFHKGIEPELDAITKIAFSPFKNQFIRDNKQYIDKCESESIKGKIGNLKRWHFDLYKKLKEDYSNLDELLNIAKHCHGDNEDSTQSPPIPKSLDSDNDSKNDSDNKSDSKSDNKNDKDNDNNLSGINPQKIENSSLKGEEKKERKKLAPKKERNLAELQYPYTSNNFIQVWDELVLQPKWYKKTTSALQASLVQLSKYSEDVAIEMMLQSIAGNYQGLFEIKKFNNGKSNSEIDSYNADLERRAKQLADNIGF